MTCRSCNPSRCEPCSQMSRKARCGRRASMAVNASSAFLAVRVPWPSSDNMPETISRMSASSSTMRMSLGMIFHARSTGALFCGRQILAGKADRALRNFASWKIKPDAGALTARRIEKFDTPAMILEDLGDDREAEARAFGARRHIGLEQTMPIFVREAFAVVGDEDFDDLLRRHVERHDDLALDGLGFATRRNPFGRVLDDIGDRLRQKPAVEIDHEGRFRQPILEFDVWMADAHEKDDAAHAIGKVVARQPRARHPRKGREF